MRTYLVTGGAGFIGSKYIHYMFRKYDNEIRIINVDKLTYAGNLENLKDIEDRDNYTFVKADICDKEAISKIFAENDIDRVVHFAAESHVDRSIKNPEVFVQTNVLGTAVMLNCAKAAWELEDGTFKEGKKFLHVSTDEVYGSIKSNEESGIFGTYNSELPDNDVIEVEEPDNVKLGSAQIRTVINASTVKNYDIEIINIEKNDTTKNILFKITDKELLNLTGGVVAGMSGSPIIQNNKIIGAVTHVVVNDPQKGYGIFITTMLKEGDKQSN